MHINPLQPNTTFNCRKTAANLTFKGSDTNKPSDEGPAEKAIVDAARDFLEKNVTGPILPFLKKVTPQKAQEVGDAVQKGLEKLAGTATGSAKETVETVTETGKEVVKIILSKAEEKAADSAPETGKDESAPKE